jgi:TolB-like protein/class 3 adenylate cyclase
LTAERVERRLAAVLAADVAGYSRLMGLDEEGTLARLKAIRKSLVDPTIAANRGRIVKTTGDGMLVEFASAVDAGRCAVEAQRGMAVQNAAVPQNTRIEFRIGIHVGDIIIDENDIFGDGVNIAARLEGIAEPGGVCLSDDAYRQIRGKVEIACDDLGPQTLKNIAEPMRAWRVKLDGQSAVTAQPPSLASQAPALALPDKPSIAVLPFQNMSGDPEQEYFADGIVEDITTALSRVKWFFVTARNSSFTYKGKAVDVRQVGRELGVRYVLEGSIRRSGNRVRVTAQLIDASSGDHLWADKYDAAVVEIFDLQDQIVEKLIGAIEPKLRVSEIARVRRKRPENLNAFDLVLQALPKQMTMTAEGFAEAIELLDRAIEIAPTYAQALGNAAWCRAMRPFHGVSLDPARDLREASGLSRRALDADPEDPLALRMVAVTVVVVDRNYRAGLDFIDQSLAIDPNSAFAWGMRGWINVWAGDPVPAITEFEKALRLSPFDQWVSNYMNGMACAFNFAGRFEEGLHWARKCMQHNPNWSASHRQLVASLFLAGQHVEAEQAAKAFLQIEPTFSVRAWSETAPFRRTPEQERLFAALRLAGLPE